MKTKILTGLLIIFCFGVFHSAEAAPAEQITLRVGNQTTLFRRDLTVQFVSVLDDSRCPRGTQCITAGNATIRVRIRQGSRPWRTLDIKLDGNNSIEFFRGYRIDLLNLTPVPRENVRINRFQYRATLRITR
jgi:hypothetical protein